MVSFLRTLVAFAVVLLISVGLMFGWRTFAGEPARPPVATIHDFNPKVAKTSPSEPTIEGTPEFLIDMGKALILIRDKAPGHYEYVCKYIRSVKLAEEVDNPKADATTDMQGNIKIPKKSYEQFKNDSYFLPVVLIHETEHCIRYERGEDPGELAEHNALAAEHNFLRSLGLPEDEIERRFGYHRLESRWWEYQPTNPKPASP